MARTKRKQVVINSEEANEEANLENGLTATATIEGAVAALDNGGVNDIATAASTTGLGTSISPASVAVATPVHVPPTVSRTSNPDVPVAVATPGSVTVFCEQPLPVTMPVLGSAITQEQIEMLRQYTAQKEDADQKPAAKNDTTQPAQNTEQGTDKEDVKVDREHKPATSKEKTRNTRLRTVAYASSYDMEGGVAWARGGSDNAGQHYVKNKRANNSGMKGSTIMAKSDWLSDGKQDNPVCLDHTVWEDASSLIGGSNPGEECHLEGCDRLATCSSSIPRCPHRFCETCTHRIVTTMVDLDMYSTIYLLQRAGKCPLCNRYGAEWATYQGEVISPMSDDDNIIIGYFVHKETMNTYAFRLQISFQEEALWNGLCSLLGMPEADGDRSMRTSGSSQAEPDYCTAWLSSMQEHHQKVVSIN